MTGETVQAVYLRECLGRVSARVRYFTRKLYDPWRREDLAQDARCIAWHLWRSRWSAGCNGERLGKAVAKWATYRARKRQCFTSQTRITDAIHPERVYLHGERTESLHRPDARKASGDYLHYDVASRDSEAWEIAVVSLDWPSFVQELAPLDQRIVELRQQGLSLSDVSRAVGRNTHSVSRHLRAVRAHWLTFTGEPAGDDETID